MADNTVINVGSGGDTIATDDITTLNGGAVSGVKIQRVKPSYGSDSFARDVDINNGLPITGSQAAATTVAWTSATTVNTASSISVFGFNTVSVAMSNTSTMTGGVLTFEVSPDGTNWFPIALARIDSYTVETSYTLSTVANRAWSTSTDGWTNFRVRLSTVITGTGTATVTIIPQTFAIEPIVSVGQTTAASLQMTVGAALPAGTNAMGSVRVTPATAATLTSVGAATSSTTILASNANRRMALVQNDSTAILYLAFAATAASSAYTVQLAAGDYYEIPTPAYTGIITGVWSAANGSARVTEIT